MVASDADRPRQSIPALIDVKAVKVEKRQCIRLAGVVSLACAAIVFAADVIMLGLPVSGSEIADYRILANVPEWRFRLGSYGAIIFRRTYFPRWMAALSPGIPIGVAFLITRWLPAPFGGYLLPPAVHFATPLIFGASTACFGV